MSTPDLSYIISLRRELHSIPEVGFDLPKTLAVIRRELTALGIPFTEKYGKSSIVGYIGREDAEKDGLHGIDDKKEEQYVKKGIPAVCRAEKHKRQGQRGRKIRDGAKNDLFHKGPSFHKTSIA